MSVLLCRQVLKQSLGYSKTEHKVPLLGKRRGEQPSHPLTPPTKPHIFGKVQHSEEASLPGLH